MVRPLVGPIRETGCFTMPPVFSFSAATILHCGESCTTLGVFELSRRRLRCVHFASEIFPAGPAGEGRWLEQTAVALFALNTSRQWTGPVVLVLPAHLTLTKQIKVPRVETAKRAQVIRFEAEQSIPHALAEVVWDRVVSGQRDTEEELMLVAAKRETVDQLCLAAQTAGFEPCRILPSSLVTLAAYRLARSESAQPALILNLDGRSATLLQVDGTRFAARTLALGGDTDPQQLGENEDSGSGEAWQTFVTRLAQEISRTVHHFAREGGLANPGQVFLTGGGARLAGLDVALAARLKISVELLDVHGALEINRGCASADADTSALTDLIGAAAIELLPPQPAMNLLPIAFRRRASLRRRQPWLVAAALLVVAALVPPTLHYRQVAATARSKVSAMGKALAPLRARAANIRANLDQLKQLRVQVAQFQSVHDRRNAWLRLFADLQERLVKVEDVWLEKMQLIQPEARGLLKIAVSGCMLDRTRHADNGSTETNNRVKDLLAGIASMSEVVAIENERIDYTQPGLLRFDFILVQSPSYPL